MMRAPRGTHNPPPVATCVQGAERRDGSCFAYPSEEEDAVSERSHTRRHPGDEDPYETEMARRGAPKHRFPPRECDPRVAYALVHDELLLDGVARMNLATFCTTWAEPEVLALLAESFDKNIVDKDEYPQTAELESRCVRMLADLWHSPHPGTTLGTSTTGSSEAAMLAGLAAKFRWRERRRAAGDSASAALERPNLVCGPVQVCWEKFARYFDVEIREVPMDPGRYLMGAEQCLERCDENTVMVVATLGQTFTGLFEDVAGIAAALDRLQAQGGPDIPLHVDGASGGFLAPFTAPGLVWDFRLERVKSINASGHKMGLAPLGCGWAVWRERADLPEEMIFNVNYLGGEMPTFNLNFSRPGGQVVTQYYNFIRLGHEGYARVHGATYETCRVPGRRDRRAGSLRDRPRRRVAGGHPGGLVDARGGRGARLQPVRPGRPPAGPRVAGAGLHAAGRSADTRDPAHPGAPRLQPRHGGPAAGRHQAQPEDPQGPSAERVAERSGGRLLQPQRDTRATLTLLLNATPARR